MPRSSRIIIIGAGGHALSVADAAVSSGWTVEGFYSPDGSGPAASAGPVFSSLESLDLADIALVPGIGTNHVRDDALEEVLSLFPSVTVASIIHATAWVSPSATVNPGSVILVQASVGPGSVLGRGALVNTGASVDHESSLGDFSSLGPGVRTGGNVEIGPRTMVGMQAGILQGVTVGADTVIGAQSLVTSDIDSNVVAWGTPARVVRKRSREDRYY